ESSAQGESCGSYLPPPEAPIMQTVPTVFTTVNLNTTTTQLLPFCLHLLTFLFPQIFPDPVEVVLGPETSLNSLAQNHQRERLPSIVVEPTEVSEVESGELRWPPENVDTDEDEEDLFLEQCIPPANIADWGEEEEEDEEATASVILNLQSDAFQDDTPTLPPNCVSTLNRTL
uniref:LBH domain-containing protein n=1 Tax=Hippocampus comes TaxID=109280 RepID=A0A3Q2XUJ1_HIPCM